MAYQEGQLLTGSDGRPYVVRNGVPVLDTSDSGMMITKPASSAYQYEGPKAAVDLESARMAAAAAAAKAPYARVTAAAESNKAQADAEKARTEADQARLAAANKPVVSPNQVRLQNQLQTDDVLSQISRARQLINGGWTTGVMGSLMSEIPGSARNDLTATLSTIGSNITKDTLSQLKSQSTTGASGFGALSEREGDLLRDAVAPLGQQQSKAQLLDNLDRVEKHYRNALALNNGEDPRDEGVQRRYGVIAANGAPPTVGGGYTGGDPNGGQTIATGSTKTAHVPQAENLITTMLRRGSNADDINAALEAAGHNTRVSQDQLDKTAAWQKAHPEYKGTLASVVSQTPTTAFERLSSSPLGTGVINAANAGTGGLLGAATGTTRAIQALSETNPNSALAGNIVGSTAGALGVEGLLGRAAGGLVARGGAGAASRLLASPITADVTFGAVSGATADPDNPLGGAVLGGALGAGGGMFGRGAVRTLGRASRGVQSAAVNYLNSMDVPMTVGQVLSNSDGLGRVAKAFEDKLTSAPIVGDAIRARRLEGMRGFNRAAFDQALAPIGATTNGVTNEAGIDLARTARSQAYRNALDGVNVQADAPFVNDMRAAVTAGQALPEPMRSNIGYTLPTRVGNSFDPNGGLTGDAFQQSVRGLRRDAAGVASQPYGHDFGVVANQAEDSLNGLLNRQAPHVLPAYNAANVANRNVEVLRSAVNAARNGTRVGDPGLFAPSQLADAAASNARRFGNSAGTTNQPFYELTRAGQSVLPSSIPDSGTAGRLAALTLPGALGGAGYALGDKHGGVAGATAGLGLGAALALGGTRGGQAALTNALLNRPQNLVRIGNYLVDRSAIGGMFGAGLGTALATQ